MDIDFFSIEVAELKSELCFEIRALRSSLYPRHHINKHPNYAGIVFHSVNVELIPQSQN